MKLKKIFGFSLAEMLVAIAIIGIVAALTIPVVYSNHQKKAYLISLEKNYSDINQVMSLFIVTELVQNISRSYLAVKKSEADATDITNSSGRFLKKYFDVSNDCGTTLTPCFAATYSNINGNKSAALDCSGYSVTLKNGAAICLEPPLSNGANFTPGQLFIDINGQDDPNIGGRDMFRFEIFNDATITSAYDTNTDYTTTCKDSVDGDQCLEAIIKNKWAMDY